MTHSAARDVRRDSVAAMQAVADLETLARRHLAGSIADLAKTEAASATQSAALLRVRELLLQHE